MYDRYILYHQVAVFEGVSCKDHAAALGPGGAVGVSLARKHLGSHIGTRRCGGFPAVAESKGTGKH